MMMMNDATTDPPTPPTTPPPDPPSHRRLLLITPPPSQRRHVTNVTPTTDHPHPPSSPRSPPPTLRLQRRRHHVNVTPSPVTVTSRSTHVDPPTTVATYYVTNDSLDRHRSTNDLLINHCCHQRHRSPTTFPFPPPPPPPSTVVTHQHHVTHVTDRLLNQSIYDQSIILLTDSIHPSIQSNDSNHATNSLGHQRSPPRHPTDLRLRPIDRSTTTHSSLR